MSFQDIKGRQRYGVTRIEMRVSGTAQPEAHGHTGSYVNVMTIEYHVSANKHI